ncbi:Ppx/GppA phosphatase family protein [Actinotalea fermentans]|uniref:Hydrolase n=1 Tax=Actinotalea fermentans TaxID=43671 RepID=A0A511YWY0_9CELL|nr:Ppx/GppA phosphatase family protein [Actinotalea fermentans]KGM15011.1 exopolyphosphatase [Actinotalea fermentans ATCC 43279 = JCM 9966 = DSM 3133]GEN79692.1 hydrolase [Actinotalea fermentans]
MVRVAGIDCGTNSIRLLVADVDEQGRLTDLDRRMEVVRLGQGVDRTGRLAPDALERTLDAARRYAAICAELGAERIRFVATSATRDAENRADFVAGVRDALGVEPEVIEGVEEASLSFRGATSVLAGKHPGPFLVVDIGGGSTELALGTTSVVASHSMDMGCVRLTERHLHSDPPTQEEIAAASADVVAALDAAAREVPFGRTATLVGLAGSVTTVTAHVLDLDEYDPHAIDGAVLPVDKVLVASRELLTMSRAKRSRLPFMHPGRVDVIGAGALVWSDVVSRVRSEVGIAGGRLRSVVVSEHDILDGIALSAAERG